MRRDRKKSIGAEEEKKEAKCKIWKGKEEKNTNKNFF